MEIGFSRNVKHLMRFSKLELELCLLAGLWSLLSLYHVSYTCRKVSREPGSLLILTSNPCTGLVINCSFALWKGDHKANWRICMHILTLYGRRLSENFDVSACIEIYVDKSWRKCEMHFIVHLSCVLLVWSKDLILCSDFKVGYLETSSVRCTTLSTVWVIPHQYSS